MPAISAPINLATGDYIDEAWVDAVSVAIGKLPMGFLAEYVDGTDRTTSGTTELTVCTGTYANFVAGRIYHLSVQQHFAQSVGTDTFFIRLYIGGTQVGMVIPDPRTGNQIFMMPSTAYAAGTSGSKVVNVTVARTVGTGTATMSNSSFLASKIELWDAGAAS